MTARNITPQRMLETFGSRGAIAPELVSVLLEAISKKNMNADEKRFSGSGKGIGAHALVKALEKRGLNVDAFYLHKAIKEYMSLLAHITAWWALSSARGHVQGISNSFAEKRNEIKKIGSNTLFDEYGIDVFKSSETLSGFLDFRKKDAVECVWSVVSAFGTFSYPKEPVYSDIFKPLYMDLMPRQLRHGHGEYYTPDWLADRTLDIARYKGDPSQRLLDPSCGSGTFLLRALARLRRKCKSSGIPPEKELSLILKNIAGIDLDPISVKTATANFLPAVTDLLPFNKKRKLRIPIYQADSILTEKNPEIFKRTGDSFSLVVGNPPWLNWESISEEYRQETRHLWDRHGLFPHKGMDTLLGKSKKDLSMLMAYQVMENFLAPGGSLAFVITRATIKSSGSGQGFRGFKLGDSTPIRAVKVDDVSALKPFGPVAAAPIIIALKKGESTRYPTPYTVWKRKRNLKVKPNEWSGLNEVKSLSNLIKLRAEPVDSLDPTSAWITAGKDVLPALRKILGASTYTAHAGIYSGGANGIYWFRLEMDEGKKLKSLVMVENIADSGKRKIETVRTQIESELLYPLLRPRELKRWSASPVDWTLVVQDPQKRRGIDEAVLKNEYPHAWDYLHRFEKILRKRAAWRRFFTRRAGSEIKETGPFYSMFAVGNYTFAPYKVAWPRVASSLNAAVLSTVYGKPLLPHETITFIPFDNPTEAHFVCALINSTPVEFAAKAYSQVGGKGFASPHLLQYLNIPKFDPSKQKHKALASISKEAHVKKSGISNDLTSTFQSELDKIASTVLGLTPTEYKLIIGERERLDG